MTLVKYDPEMTMHAARRVYFDVNAFGEDGGYSSPWIDFKLGPIPFPVPNVEARVRAVRYHDLHHIVTGYDTDFTGEMEISAWEIGAGCKNVPAAWVLNLMGMGAFWVAPRRVFRAFVRGRASDSLYGLPLEPLLSERVREVRDRMHVPEAAPKVTLGDAIRFVAGVAAGTAMGIVFLTVLTPIAPFGSWVLSKRKAADHARRTVLQSAAAAM